MINTVRYSLLTSGILLSSMALAAPAGDLPLMPWPAHVERPQAQGALALNNQLTINVSGDDLGEGPTAGVNVLRGKPAGRYSRRRRRQKAQPLT